MKALVTGVAGFVGSTLAQRLISEGWDVVGIDALTDYYDVGLKRQNLSTVADTGGEGSFRFIEQDLRESDLESELRDADVVFHQAGQPGVRKSWGSDFSDYITCNIDATQRLLEAAAKAPRLKRLVYASSSSVYGDAESYPTKESFVPKPRSPYGVTKLAAEHLCNLYAANFGVPTVSLRYFTVYGPRQRPDMAFTRFLRSVSRGEPVTLYGDGEQVRDFTFIDDIVRANILAATHSDVSPGDVFNVSGGSSVSVNEVLEWIGEISGRRVLIDRFPAVSGDVQQTGGDANRVQTALGWEPEIDVFQGLTRQWDWVTQTQS